MNAGLHCKRTPEHARRCSSPLPAPHSPNRYTLNIKKHFQNVLSLKTQSKALLGSLLGTRQCTVKLSRTSTPSTPAAPSRRAGLKWGPGLPPGFTVQEIHPLKLDYSPKLSRHLRFSRGWGSYRQSSHPQHHLDRVTLVLGSGPGHCGMFLSPWYPSPLPVPIKRVSWLAECPLI